MMVYAPIIALAATTHSNLCRFPHTHTQCTSVYILWTLTSSSLQLIAAHDLTSLRSDAYRDVICVHEAATGHTDLQT